MKNALWNDYEDNLDWEKFFKEGKAYLYRRYFNNGDPLKDSGSVEYITSNSAKGISAFLSYREYPPKFCGPSLYQLLLKEKPLLLEEKIFPEYYAICHCRFMESEEKREMFGRKRKKEPELIKEHINEEEQYFKDSSLLFNEVHEVRKSRIEKIKEAALYYPTWVKDTHLHDAPDPKSVQQKNKVGRPQIIPRPLMEYFRILNDVEISVILDIIKLRDYCRKPTEFAYLIVALYDLGYLIQDDREIFMAFEEFFNTKVGGQSIQNKALNNAKGERRVKRREDEVSKLDEMKIEILKNIGK